MPPMQNSSPSSLRQRIKTDPHLQLPLLFFAGFLITYLLVVVLILRLYRQQVEVTLQEYGGTVAHQLAQASVDALLRDDRLSLHAQLENIIKAPNVAEAAVYDMENRLIAQATDPAGDEMLLRHYPATITFQDSIVGKVMIGLDTRPLLKNHHWLYGYLLCGLLLCLFITLGISRIVMRYGTALYQRLIHGIHQLQPRITSDLAETGTTDAPSLDMVEKNLQQLQEYVQQLEQGAPVVKFTQTGKFSYQPPQGSYAELLIDCANFDALQQQVHHRELQRLLETLQSSLQAASQLYHADDVHSPGNHVLLRFQHNDITDAALQAICCAVVIRSLVRAAIQVSSIPLQLRFAIHWHEHDERPVPDLLRNHLLLQEQQELQQLCSLAKSNEVLVSKGIKRSAGVAEHIKLELISGDSDVDFYRVQQLSDNYKKLLEQQAVQLAENIDAC
jgi:uncharacterized membrane protein affecting hemolysin expression